MTPFIRNAKEIWNYDKFGKNNFFIITTNKNKKKNM